MSDSTMAQAKRDFGLGHLKTFKLTRVPMSENWGVFLGSGAAAGWLIDARTKGPREFKTLDAAVSALHQIGFQITELQ